MNATELRIGNYLTFKGSSRVNVKLYRFDLSAILYNEDEVLHYEPIELTEEILLKRGFIEDGYYNSAKRFKLRNIILFQGNGYYILCGYPLTEIRYLHQLQNIYFALTNEELNINL